MTLLIELSLLNLSVGSAWDYDEKTDEYYLHIYVSKQPDFNWENEDVRHAVWDLMDFWLKRGCDGFRMDVINKISKVPGLPDAPITLPDEEYQPAGMYYLNGPRVHEFIKEVHTNVLSRYDTMTVGETPYSNSADEIAAYVLPQNKELNEVFVFELMEVDTTIVEGPNGSKDHRPMVPRKWELPEFKEIVARWQHFKRNEGFWNTVFLENHDHARSVSRFGDDSEEWRSISAKLLAMMNVTLGGTLYVYQGQELAMKNFPRSWGIEEYQDVASQNYYNKILDERKKESNSNDVDMSDVLDGFQRKARDHARTPMQVLLYSYYASRGLLTTCVQSKWDNSPNAGFTTGKPWMRVNEDFSEWNVAKQAGDPNSILTFWKKALKVRRDNELFVSGEFELLSPSHEKIFAYRRKLGNAKALVLLNFSRDEVSYTIPELDKELAHLSCALSNYADRFDAFNTEPTVILRGYEGIVYIG
ncbi:hypothetical protein ONZ45_g18727 [Pleurotus djamor]|nr:hypothetical protein ONZ45_g18727 [Pleurotus djamor]